MTTVTLPFPPKELSPNARLHWRRKAAAAKAYRETCWALCLESKLRLPDADRIELRLDFYPPDRRHRDDDNMIAAFKAGRDGVAQALQMDDRRFSTRTTVHDEPRGCVVLELAPVGEAVAIGDLIPGIMAGILAKMPGGAA